MVDPRHTERDAYLVVAVPTEFSNRDIIQLFLRGYDCYLHDDDLAREDLISDIEQFGTAAFENAKRERPLEYPFVDDPGMLVLLATLSTLCVEDQPRFEETPLRRNQVVANIRELFATNVLALLYEYDDPTLYQEIAEVLYAKPPNDDGPHPGRVCTDVTTMPEFDDEKDKKKGEDETEEELYVEIPMAAASRACLARSTSEATSAEETGEILTRIANGNLYIPLAYVRDRYRTYVDTGFGCLRAAQEDDLSDEERNWLATTETAITDRTDRAIELGHYQQIWTTWDRGERVVQLIREAMRTDPRVQIGEFHTATELYEALEAYNPDNEGEHAQLQQLSSPRSVGNTLADHDSHRSVTIDRTGRANTYQIGHSGGGARPIEITELEDFFELPCMAAMDDKLHEDPPVRKDLFNFVRMTMWLPQYRDKPIDEITEQIQDLFSRWPWHDSEITDYQVKYEHRRGERGIGPKGNTPLPMGCDNDDMQRHCIGKDQCPYSIYGSLPFPDEMYDQLDESEDWF
ncbi:primase-associated protein [Saliphagus infecundisoli]|uniref:Primase-associated protein n=1 Tax=Saliphagus infecundisoli TaxID=1849069 RepID=A0ABD5QIT4_9EURY|nr:primase-associated protein [Saliphagus infecundisoli]